MLWLFTKQFVRMLGPINLYILSVLENVNNQWFTYHLILGSLSIQTLSFTEQLVCFCLQLLGMWCILPHKWSLMMKQYKESNETKIAIYMQLRRNNGIKFLHVHCSQESRFLYIKGCKYLKKQAQISSSKTPTRYSNMMKCLTGHIAANKDKNICEIYGHGHKPWSDISKCKIHC